MAVEPLVIANASDQNWIEKEMRENTARTRTGSEWTAVGAVTNKTQQAEQEVSFMV
jgi:hypothetical protein